MSKYKSLNLKNYQKEPKTTSTDKNARSGRPLEVGAVPFLDFLRVLNDHPNRIFLYRYCATNILQLFISITPIFSNT